MMKAIFTLFFSILFLNIFSQKLSFEDLVIIQQRDLFIKTKCKILNLLVLLPGGCL